MTVIKFAELYLKITYMMKGFRPKPQSPHPTTILLTYPSFLPLTKLFQGAHWVKWELDRYGS